MQKYTPFIMLTLYLIVFAVCAFNPFNRDVWWAENIPIMLIVLTLIIIYPFYKFSPASYVLMSVLIIMHTIGGHYTFERVPFGFVTDLLGATRNHYDRIAHFSVGFYAFPIAELLLEKNLVRSRIVLLLFPLFAIFTVAGGYEIIEWLYAASAGSVEGSAVLGSQGDIWDAQKDMTADALGAVVSLFLFFGMYFKKIKNLNKI